jgi:hypothetical protein
MDKTFFLGGGIKKWIKLSIVLFVRFSKQEKQNPSSSSNILIQIIVPSPGRRRPGAQNGQCRFVVRVYKKAAPHVFSRTRRTTLLPSHRSIFPCSHAPKHFRIPSTKSEHSSARHSPTGRGRNRRPWK